jgi:hypothetical protein
MPYIVKQLAIILDDEFGTRNKAARAGYIYSEFQCLRRRTEEKLGDVQPGLQTFGSKF